MGFFCLFFCFFYIYLIVPMILQTNFINNTLIYIYNIIYIQVHNDYKKYLGQGQQYLQQNIYFNFLFFSSEYLSIHYLLI